MATVYIIVTSSQPLQVQFSLNIKSYEATKTDEFLRLNLGSKVSREYRFHTQPLNVDYFVCDFVTSLQNSSYTAGRWLRSAVYLRTIETLLFYNHLLTQATAYLCLVQDANC